LKKILLISYYWPPAGGIAVQRWLKTTYYLKEIGWDISVCTSENPDYPHIDLNLEKQTHSEIKVIKIKGFEPRKELAKLQSLFGKKDKTNLDNSINSPDKNQSFFQKMIVWIRSNIFIPDARISWSKNVAKTLSSKLKNDLPDIIISTGPPHSTHLAAMELAQKFNIPWVADFRDPWQEIEYFENLKLTKSSREKHHKLEKAVLQNADLVITVSPSWAKLFESKGAKKTAVIFNGFDEKDFSKITHQSHEKFIISHIGTMGMDRFVIQFYDALKEFLKENKEFKDLISIEFAGNTDKSIIEFLENDEVLKHNFKNHGFISHEESIHLMQNSSLLLLIQNNSENNIKGRIPAKFFEYLAIQKPILLIGDTNSDLAQMMKDDNIGYVTSFEDKTNIQKALQDSFLERKHQKEISNNILQKYTRVGITRQLSDLLNQILK
jgi:glycosyltransferase involved in cell wall biosynthesis